MLDYLKDIECTVSIFNEGNIDVDLSNYNYEIQLFKELSEYAHLAELLEKDMEELRKATFEIGDVESVYVPMKSE